MQVLQVGILFVCGAALAIIVEAYVHRMPVVATTKELLAKGLLTQLAAQRSRAHSEEREHSIGDHDR